MLFRSAKDAEQAEKIDAQVTEAEPGGVDLLTAEEQAKRDVLAERERNLARQLDVMRQRPATLVDPLQYVMSIAAEDLANYEPCFAWERRPPTKKQLQLLEKWGLHTGGVENAGMASRLIDRMIFRQRAGLATPKQIRCLERFGFRQVGTWTFEAAAGMIGRLAENDWNLPPELKPAAYRP